jgi:hypothetical protein
LKVLLTYHPPLLGIIQLTFHTNPFEGAIYKPDFWWATLFQPYKKRKNEKETFCQDCAIFPSTYGADFWCTALTRKGLKKKYSGSNEEFDTDVLRLVLLFCEDFFKMGVHKFCRAESDEPISAITKFKCIICFFHIGLKQFFY